MILIPALLPASVVASFHQCDKPVFTKIDMILNRVTPDWPRDVPAILRLMPKNRPIEEFGGVTACAMVEVGRGAEEIPTILVFDGTPTNDVMAAAGSLAWPDCGSVAPVVGSLDLERRVARIEQHLAGIRLP